MDHGKLKVFFGWAAGVGKTYAMLEAALKARASGLSVAAFIESQGRPDIERLAASLEKLPTCTSERDGQTSVDLHVEATVERHPDLALVDELAHTNTSEGRNPKRWHDVFELLDAGINVHTTLNVQNLESLRDHVATLTGFAVSETVPDAVLERADEVELVDLPPDELLVRWSEGKVFGNERAQQAFASFFEKSNLVALRQLVLERTAHTVKKRVRGFGSEHGIARAWEAHERLLACVGPSPQSALLIQAARRLASKLDAKWYAVSVELASAQTSPADRAAVEEHLALAERLGAKIVRLSGGGSPGEQILSLARRENVTQIVVGKPMHARWMDRVFGSFLDDLIRNSGDINVYVIGGDRPGPQPSSR